jgi:uncharacterized protein
MDFSSALFLAVGFLYIVAVVFIANRQEASGQPQPILRWLLFGLLGIMFMVGLTLFQTAFLGNVEGVFNVDPASALMTFGFTLVAILMSYWVISDDPRMLALIQRVAGTTGGYQPTSSIHNTAVVLILLLLVLTIGAFVLGGGTSGLAQDLESTGVSPFEPLLIAMLQIAIAFLGVGLAVRRTLPQSLERLGLTLPTPHEYIRGVSSGIGLFVIYILFVIIWQSVTPPEQVVEQTEASQQLAEVLGTPLLAFIASLSAAFGEEIFMRGALQPIFGLLPTSIFFVLLHTQYLVTPGLLLILIISLGFGWLRQRYNTTTAIIAHFVYNFIQLLLVVFITTSVG